MSTLDAEKHGNDTHTHTHRSLRYHFLERHFLRKDISKKLRKVSYFSIGNDFSGFDAVKLLASLSGVYFLDGLFRGGAAVWYRPGHNEWIYLNTQVHIGEQLFTLQLPYTTTDLGYLFSLGNITPVQATFLGATFYSHPSSEVCMTPQRSSCVMKIRWMKCRLETQCLLHRKLVCTLEN